MSLVFYLIIFDGVTAVLDLHFRYKSVVFFQLLLDASFDFLKLNRFSCFGVKLYMRIQILDSVIFDGVTAFFGLKFNIISIKD